MHWMRMDDTGYKGWYNAGGRRGVGGIIKRSQPYQWHACQPAPIWRQVSLLRVVPRLGKVSHHHQAQSLPVFLSSCPFLSSGANSSHR
jgi:hypothetical protein